MLRAIIADDEPKVCSLIQQLGEWDRLEVEVVATCYDGEEALSKITELRPDIVITDIRMPIYDGLELMRRSRDCSLDTAFVVISGYRQFEYAQNAIQYGVVSYLLKPIDAGQLNSVLEKICQERRAKNLEQENLLRLQSEHKNQGERAFFNLLLEGNVSPDQLLQYQNEYGVKLSAGYCRAVAINTSRPELHQPDSVFGKSVVECATRIFTPFAELLTNVWEGGILMVIIYDHQEQNEVTRAISELFSQVRSLRDVFGDFDLALGLGRCGECPKDLVSTVQTALENEHGKILNGWNRITEQVIGPDGRDWAEKPFPSEQAKALSSALDAFNAEEVEKWFRNWNTQLQSQHHLQLQQLLAQRDWLIDELTAFDSEATAQLPARADRVKNASELVKLLQWAYINALERSIQRRNQEESRPIRLAKDYIRIHYAEQISLEEVAAQAGFSDTYFSTLFKRVTGQSFSEYLGEARLDAAKQLLKEGKLTISEVSEAVGYADHKYFRKKFKKATGIKPNDYRKLYG